MSLDVYLEAPLPTVAGSGIFVRENGSTRELTRVEWDERFPGLEPIVAETDEPALYEANITHNLNEMADEAGIYKHLWRPDEIGISVASELVGPLSAGLTLLKADPNRFRAFNPSNGWGSYEGLVRFVEGYLDACLEHPTARVRTCR